MELPQLDPRPRLRGKLHAYAFPAAVVLAVALVWKAESGRATLAAAVFGACVALMLGTSALYHRVLWGPRARRLMRRADHAAIYLLIAGTYTPYGLIVLDGGWRWSVLAIVWTGAAVAIVQKLVWVDAPTWVAAAIGIGLGWIGVVAFPEIFRDTGLGGTILLAGGGLLYTVGAIVYARKRPDPVPHVFGYHELFHALVIGAALCQYAAIAFFVLPRA
jgi:hemolysin III